MYKIINPDVKINHNPENKSNEKQATEKKLLETNSPDYYIETPFIGNSMNEYGFIAGKNVRVYINKKCEIGSACDFTCNVKKCTKNGQPRHLKILKKTKDNCYWFEGNKRSYMEPDGEYTSFDSKNNYGWLCGNEITIGGFVPFPEPVKPVVKTQPVTPDKEETIGDSGMTAKQIEERLKELENDDYVPPVASSKPIKIDPLPPVKIPDYSVNTELKQPKMMKPHYETVCWNDTLLGKQCKTTMSIY